MRILLLCTDAFGGYGGIALFNREFIRSLAAFPGCDEVVVLPRLIRSAMQPLPDRVTYATGAARGTAAYLRTFATVIRRRFDLVISGHVNLLPLARLAGHPLLITHGIDAWKPMRTSRSAIGACRGVVSVSDLTRQRFLAWSHYGGATFVLPNAVRADSYGIRPKNAALAARLGLAGRRVLLTVGRVSARERYKGFDEVIEILPRLVPRYPDLMYLVAGGGNDVRRLEKKAASLGVADRVVFTGVFPDEEKADLYNLADVYVMPSRGEGFGFVFLEAMASGVPVIGSCHDGGREALLEGELGTLVDPANGAAIAAAVTDALESGTRAVPGGLTYFAFERFVERVHAIVRKTIA